LSPYEAAQEADAILVLTEWNEFRELDWDNLARSVAHPLLIDGRNLYFADEVTSHGFQYVCIGKEPSSAHIAPAPTADRVLSVGLALNPQQSQAVPVQSRP
jgi:UDP-glucose/GDP-mannose dehydrogenase family, UDP binding domain